MQPLARRDLINMEIHGKANLGQLLERARRDQGESRTQKIFSPVHISLIEGNFCGWLC
ncbi:hypothetical protein DPMN_170712 [Dreissena polymorpha]|uniref:Uncharacterized protein n=1 Tax=Dreissena polymorpha TaxID=45954 RepID=A0A9D4IEU1_DREPO|nr:hypothetical protein DPMN_170712 [Dreissena polymorpha]